MRQDFYTDYQENPASSQQAQIAEGLGARQLELQAGLYHSPCDLGQIS